MQTKIYGLELLKKPHRSSTKEIIERVLDAINLDDLSLELSLVSDESMITLQKKFKKKDRTTDVLSFPIGFPENTFPHFENFLGEIVISVDQAERQAKQYGHSLTEEIAVLSAHGLMHLLGFDHERSKIEAKRQMRAECLLLELAGLDPQLSLFGRTEK